MTQLSTISLKVVPRIYSSFLKSLTNIHASIIVSAIMETIILTIFACVLLLFLDKNLLLENLALKQQLAIMKQKNKRPKIRLRDCINAMIILNEAHLRHILTEYLVYYHEDRTHLGLGKETPAGRSVQEKPDNAKVVAFPRLGGLHHRYEWQEAA